MEKKQTISTKRIVLAALMAALTIVGSAIRVTMPIDIAGTTSFHLGNSKCALSGILLGPWYGALVCLLKNLIHRPVTSSSGVGELANFLIGVCFVIPTGYIYKFHKTRKGALVGSLVGAVIMAAISFPINYFIVYPFYTNFMPIEAIVGAYQTILPSIKGLGDALLIFNVPFTFVKGMIDVVITFLVYKRLSPIIKGTNSTKQTPDV